MIVEIDDRSGFCFGVVRAIRMAEENLPLVSLGDIVHNGAEVARLEALGLESVPEDTDPGTLAGRRVLIRAHGEPPATYAAARKHDIELVDATCPVVAALQRTVAAASEQMRNEGGQVVIFGRAGHAEVRGLVGQTDGNVVIVESEADLDHIDFTRPVYFLAQTTGSLYEFRRLGAEIEKRAKGGVTIRDTICRQVADRETHLADFARRFDVVVFVAGAKSSNGKVLFDAVRAANPNSHKIATAAELRPEWFVGAESVGICGATSTPLWLMKNIANELTR